MELHSWSKHILIASTIAFLILLAWLFLFRVPHTNSSPSYAGKICTNKFKSSSSYISNIMKILFKRSTPYDSLYYSSLPKPEPEPEQDRPAEKTIFDRRPRLVRSLPRNRNQEKVRLPRKQCLIADQEF
jgi:hypothetical protein